MYACMPFPSVGVAFEYVSLVMLLVRRKAIIGVGEATRLEKRDIRSKSWGRAVWSEEGLRRRKRKGWSWWLGRARSWVWRVVSGELDVRS